MNNKALKRVFYSALLLAQLSALIGFLVLGDVTQWIIQFPRFVTMQVFAHRVELIGAGIGGLSLAILLHYKTKTLSNRAMLLQVFLFLSVFIGYFVSPYILFQTQQHDARFISIPRAVDYLRADDDVFVLENKGDVRVFPLKWMTQPHVAADIIGGDEIAMTFCALSNLGIAYSPVLDNGRRLDFKVMLQLENNLVLFDEYTDEPFQQITGVGESTRKKLRQYPTQRMTWSAFNALYDRGKVYFNPPDSPLDSLARFIVARYIRASRWNSVRKCRA